ncbi:hypothetical protein KBC54_01200 [Patescibacteria group bacterium]|nr:hypothetical protein [Patescibacteria group bacterium]
MNESDEILAFLALLQAVKAGHVLLTEKQLREGVVTYQHRGYSFGIEVSVHGRNDEFEIMAQVKLEPPDAIGTIATSLCVLRHRFKQMPVSYPHFWNYAWFDQDEVHAECRMQTTHRECSEAIEA